MPITITYSKDQAQGAFDSGRIMERKPIGFPQDGGSQKPYSTLFYWAHAWSDKGGLIGEHPHKGFEIMSYILTGEIEHYDSKFKGWKKLKAGDLQIIRAGNGITHAEKINPGSSIFQIWFDPNLDKTLAKPATYNDYSSEVFPVFKDEESEAKILFGGTPFTMDSKVDYIQEITYTAKEKTYPLNKESVYSFFILEGALETNGKKMGKGDFAVISGEDTLKFTSIAEKTKIFLIKSPKVPGFKTYAEMMEW